MVEEVRAILFLNRLSSRYSQLKHTLKYGNKALSLQDVISSARSLERELDEQRKLIRTPLQFCILMREADLRLEIKIRTKEVKAGAEANPTLMQSLRAGTARKRDMSKRTVLLGKGN